MRRRTEAHRPMGNLRLNQAKTVEIVFYARGRHRAEDELPPSLPGIQRVSSIKVLGVTVIINCQWLDMFLHCWTPVQEHCTVCGFSEPMVFTKTVWTKCSAVRWYWPSCCVQVLHGQASVLQQTTANLIGSLTDVENCIIVSS